MDLFDSKRQERLAAAAKAATASKEAAKAFLIRAGIMTPNGELAPHLRQNRGESLYSRRSNLVIGFHGCDKTIVDAVVAGKTDFLPRGINQDYPNP